MISGLPSAGKTTVLYRAKLDQPITAIPTLCFNVETIRLSSTRPIYGEFWDVGKFAPYQLYYSTTDACVWVVDSANAASLEESVDECLRIAKEVQTYHIKKIPFLVLANKQDLPNAMSSSKVRASFSRALSNTIYEVFATPTQLPGNGHSQTRTEAFHWLADTLTQVSDVSQSKPSIARSVSPLQRKLESYLTRSIADDKNDSAEFLKDFREASILTWDHYTRLRIIFLLLTTFGRQKGKDMIFEGFSNYCTSSSCTFHFTLTYFWIQLVHFGIQSIGLTRQDLSSEKSYPDGVPTDFSRFLLLNSHLVDEDLWSEYYSRDVVTSRLAEEDMVLPDKKQLPSLML